MDHWIILQISTLRRSDMNSGGKLLSSNHGWYQSHPIIQWQYHLSQMKINEAYWHYIHRTTCIYCPFLAASSFLNHFLSTWWGFRLECVFQSHAGTLASLGCSGWGLWMMKIQGPFFHRFKKKACNVPPLREASASFQPLKHVGWFDVKLAMLQLVIASLSSDVHHDSGATFHQEIPANQLKQW